MTNTKHESTNYNRDGVRNKNQSITNRQLTNKTERHNTDSNIWNMFDDSSKSCGGRTRRRESDEKQNKKQTKNNKRFKPSGELVNKTMTTKTITTDKESTCAANQTLNIVTHSRKRRRCGNEVDEAPTKQCELNCHKSR